MAYSLSHHSASASKLGAGGDELASSSVEIVPNALYACALRRFESVRLSPTARQNIVFCIDDELVYEPFFADFGPLNLGQTYRYCARLDALLDEAAQTGKRVYHVMSADPHYRANSAVLLGAYCVLFLEKTAEDALGSIAALKPFTPFRDASCGPTTYNLSVLDSIRALERAKACGIVDFHLREKSSFNIDEYEHCERVENGDMNWTLPGRFLAFSGPSAKRTEFYGYRTAVPEDYHQRFRAMGITAIIRLNKKMYDRRRFTDAGFRHYDLYFPDGSCPSDTILRRFLEITESEHAAGGACAVHCKAGLGRTGVLVGCYLMKHFRFTAAETIAHLRICRPGSVIGPQQQYLCEMEQRMWREGEAMRREDAKARTHADAMDVGDAANVAGAAGDMYRTSPVKSLRSGTTPSIYSPIARGGSASGGGGMDRPHESPTMAPGGPVPSGSGMAAVNALHAGAAAGAASRARGYAAPYQHRDKQPLRTQVAASQPDLRALASGSGHAVGSSAAAAAAVAAGANAAAAGAADVRRTPNGRHVLAATMATDTLANATRPSPSIYTAGLPPSGPRYSGGARGASSNMLPPNAGASAAASRGALNRLGQGTPSAAVIQRIVTAQGQPRKLVVPAGAQLPPGAHLGVATRYEAVAGAPAPHGPPTDYLGHR